MDSVDAYVEAVDVGDNTSVVDWALSEVVGTSTVFEDEGVQGIDHDGRDGEDVVVAVDRAKADVIDAIENRFVVGTRDWVILAIAIYDVCA